MYASYDALGRLVRLTLADGKAHTISYDTQGRVARITRSEVGALEFEYDSVSGLLVRKTFKGDNQKVSINFNFVMIKSVGRLKKTGLS